MADNIDVTPGTGKTIAADEVAAALHQRVKLSLGADGSATDALGGAGAVAAGVQRVTLASDDPLVTALTSVASGASDSGNPVKIGARYNSTLPTFTNGQRGDLQIDSRGNTRALLVAPLVAAGDGLASFVASPTNTSEAAPAAVRMLPAATFVFNGATFDRIKKPSAASRITSAAASTNATVAKASAGDLFTAVGYNAAATLRYLKIYNKATAPTVGTDTPVLTLALPPTAAFAFDFPSQYFSTGIAYALTTGVADSDTGALTAGDILALNLAYA